MIHGDNPGRFVILYYHAIKKEEITKFIKQLDLLKKKSIPVSLNHSSEIPEMKGRNNFTSVTFDDAFQSCYYYALPELFKRNIPVTIFVPSQCFNQNPPWLEKEVHQDKDEKIMTEEQILEIAGNPMVTIGSHGQFHKDLYRCDESTAISEITESKKNLENILKTKITSISFPYGNYTADHIAIAQNTGYDQVYTINPKTESLFNNNFIRGRVEVNPSDWKIEFYLKITGAYNWFAFLKSN